MRSRIHRACAASAMIIPLQREGGRRGADASLVDTKIRAAARAGKFPD